MSIPSAKALDSEHDRQKLVEELVAGYGPHWADHYTPGTFGCHELLDRTCLAADLLEQSVLNHPACVRDPEWFALAVAATNTLRELYQRIGAEHLEAEGGGQVEGGH